MFPCSADIFVEGMSKSAIGSSLRGSGESKYPLVATLGGMREVRGNKGAIGARGAGTSRIVKRNWVKAVGKR